MTREAVLAAVWDVVLGTVLLASTIYVATLERATDEAIEA